MNKEEFHNIIKEGLYQLSDFNTSTYVDRLNVIKDIGQMICDNTSINEFELGLELKTKKVDKIIQELEYVTVSFRDDFENKYFVTYLFNTDTFEDRLYEIIISITDGCKAIEIINNIIEESFESNGNNNQLVKYVWGYKNHCHIGAWDYKEFEIILSKTSIITLCEMYAVGENSYTEKVREAIRQSELSNHNMVEFIDIFNNITLNKLINAEIKECNIADSLQDSMISRNTALEWLKNHKKDSGIQSVKVVEHINQLGSFVALALWRVNYSDKTVEISLIDEKVIDTDSLSFVTNYAICSRIEQMLRLSDSEIKQIL